VKKGAVSIFWFILIKKELKINEIRGGSFDTCGGNA
jgi:hypothetical protein